MAPKRDPRYEQARRQFDELDAEEQVSFLVEATATTLARGVVEVGKRLTDGLDQVLRQASASSGASGTGPGAAEPETSQRRTPRSGTRNGNT